MENTDRIFFKDSIFTIDGNLIQSSNYEKDQGSIIFKCIGRKTFNKIKIIIETSNCTSIQTVFEFKLGQLSIKYVSINQYLQLKGDFLGNSNYTTVYLNGKEVILQDLDLEINYNGSVLSFKNTR
ncbi:hypothetical protein ACTFIY_008937 [Dictyostelium cf. discoideum]